MKSSDFLATSWPLGKDDRHAEFYALKLGTDAFENPGPVVTLYIKDFNGGGNREQIDGVPNMDDTGITLYPKEGFYTYSEMLGACFGYIHSLSFTAADAELKKVQGELLIREIYYIGTQIQAGQWEKVKYREEQKKQNGEKFTAEELNNLSNVLIAATRNARAAADQIADLPVRSEIDAYVSMLQKLNSKICSMMDGGD